MSSSYGGKSFKDRELKGYPLAFFLIRFQLYGCQTHFIKIKNNLLKTFKYVSHPLLFYIIAITTDDVKCFGYVIVTYTKYNFISFMKKVMKSFPLLPLEIFV